MPSQHTWYWYSAQHNAHAIVDILQGRGDTPALAFSHAGAVRYFGLLAILAGRAGPDQDSLAVLTRIVSLASGAAAQLGTVIGAARVLSASAQSPPAASEPVWRATHPDTWPENQPPWALVLGVGGVLSPIPLEGLVHGREALVAIDDLADFSNAGGWTALREAAQAQPPDSLGGGWPLG